MGTKSEVGNVSVIGYNVSGLRRELYDHNFIKFIKYFDVFCLSSVEEHDSGIVKNILAEYELRIIPAIRKSTRGRACGGIVIGFSKV